MGALLVASVSTFVSCKDYDDDINDLRALIDKNAKAIENINTQITAGTAITTVTSAADGGVGITLSNGQTYTIVNGKDGKDGADGQNGKDGKDGTVWTIGDDGYWYLNGEKTDYYALGTQGAQGEKGEKGDKGDKGDQGDQGEKGDKGDKGDQGDQGEKGDKGDKGDKGAKGDKGDKGDKGADGKNGADGADGADGKDGVNPDYYVPNAETGFFDVYKWDAATGKYVKSATTISFLTPGVITAVMDNNNLTLYGVKDKDGKVDPKGIIIPLNNALRSMVFAGDDEDAKGNILRTYLDGVPAIQVKSFAFRELTVSNKDSKTEIWKKKNGATDKDTYINPVTYAYYHVNPSNVNVEDLKSLSYVVKADAQYIVTRTASKDFTATAEFESFKDGILKVKVTTGGQPAESDGLQAYKGKNDITVIALQATKKVGNENEVITSDYTAVYKANINDLIIAENQQYAGLNKYEGKENYPGVADFSHAKNVKDYHFREGDNVMSGNVNAFTISDLNAGTLDDQIVWDETTADLYAEGQDPTVDWKLAYNKSYDLYALTAVHESNKVKGYQNATGVCNKNTLAALGLKLKFEVVKNYKLPVNGAVPQIFTPQEKFISLDEETGIVKADVYGEENKIAAVGRTPIIRAKLVQESTGKVVRVSYIKIQWVRASAAPVAEKCYDLYLDDYAFGCNGGKLRTSVEQINVQLYTKLNMSKEQFHKAYPYFQDTYVAKNTKLIGEDSKEYTYDGDIVGWVEDTTDPVVAYASTATPATTYGKGKDGKIQSVLAGMEGDAFVLDGSTLRNFSTGGNSTYEITMAAPADVLWDYAGKEVTNVVTFASAKSADNTKLEGSKIQVRLISKVKGVTKAAPLTHDADYRDAYWDAAFTYTSYNVNVPNEATKWNPNECLYRNNLNMSFKTYGAGDGIYNGIVKLPGINKTDIKRIVYHFCKKDVEAIKSIGGIDVEFLVLDNDKSTWNQTTTPALSDNRADTLLARKKGSTGAYSVIAYIQNYEIKAGNDAQSILAGDASVKDVYNLFEYNKDNANLAPTTGTIPVSKTKSITYTTDATLAKQLLNTEKMYTLIGAYAEICDINTLVKTVEISYDGQDHFQANIIKPVYGEENKGALIYDAVNFPINSNQTKKSYIRLEDMLDLYEWRYLFDNSNKAEYLFQYPTYNTNGTYKTTGSWHWSFYGPFTITVNPANVECDIDGTRTKVPAGFYVGYNQFGTGAFAPGVVGAAANDVNITDPTDDTPSGHFVKTEFGVLTYHNNGTKLTKDRHLYVPIKVQYGWGEFTIWATVLIKATDEA